jgi:hypothetical protein
MTPPSHKRVDTWIARAIQTINRLFTLECGATKQARKPENHTTSEPAQGMEPEINLSIKVSKSLHRHWVAEAKRHDTTLTAAIIVALKARFGEPN